MSRDPTDDKFLECAVAGKADYLVSADADLLRIFGLQRTRRSVEARHSAPSAGGSEGRGHSPAGRARGAPAWGPRWGGHLTAPMR
jgi:hypothetical protein